VKESSEQKTVEVLQRMHTEVSERISLISLDFPIAELRSSIHNELDDFMKKSGLGTTPTTQVQRLVEHSFELQRQILAKSKVHGDWWTQLREQMDLYTEDCGSLRDKIEYVLSNHKEEMTSVPFEVLKQIRLVERRGNVLLTLSGCGPDDPYAEVLNLTFVQKKPPAVPKSHEMFEPSSLAKANEVFEDVVAIGAFVPAANVEVEIHLKEDKKMKKYNDSLAEERGQAVFDGLLRNGIPRNKLKLTKVLDTPKNLNRNAVLVRFAVFGPPA